MAKRTKRIEVQLHQSHTGTGGPQMIGTIRMPDRHAYAIGFSADIAGSRASLVATCLTSKARARDAISELDVTSGYSGELAISGKIWAVRIVRIVPDPVSSSAVVELIERR